MKTITQNDHDIIVFHCLDMNKPLKFLKRLLKDEEGDYDLIMFQIREFLKKYPEASNPKDKK